MSLEEKAEELREKNSKLKKLPLYEMIHFLKMYEKTNGNSKEAERREDAFYTSGTYLKYWSLAGLKIRKRGGDQNSGKHWKCKQYVK